MLSDKNIVIIGGTTGLGLSAAQAFVKHGAAVVVTGRNPQSVSAAQKTLGPKALALSSDATVEGTAEEAITQCVRKWGGFDGLYHVAGGSGRKAGDGPIHQMSLEGWETTIRLNQTSIMLSNRAAIRQLLDQGSPGSVLNMGSVLGSSPSPKFFATHAYAATKSAVIGFSKSMAAYYASNNIRVNVIAPALVETPMAQRAAKDDVIQQFISTKQPLDGGRIGQPKDLDGLAALLFSDQGAFITGQVIAVDGGWTVSEGQIPKT